MALLDVVGLTKSFGGVRAVDDVSFSVDAGEIFSIIGPNGAGKTTIFNLLSLIYRLGSGEIRYRGESLAGVPPHRLAALGIGRTFQNIELFENATVLQNLLVGCHGRAKVNILEELLFLPAAARREAGYRAVAERVIDFLGLHVIRHQVVSGLAYGGRKNIELGRALCMEPSLLLLDEPSSGLNPDETGLMAEWILAVRDQLGVSVLLIEHDMGLVSAVSDRVLAVNYGRVVAIGTPAEVQRHPEVLTAYLGA